MEEEEEEEENIINCKLDFFLVVISTKDDADS